VAQARRRFRHHNRARAFIETEFFRLLAGSHRSMPEPDVVRDRLGMHHQVRAALEWMWPILTPAELLRDMYGSSGLLRSALRAGFHPLEIDDAVKVLRRPRGDDVDSYAWTDADVPLLDEAHAILGSPSSRRPRTTPRWRCACWPGVR
jgi:hypothetical protein